MEISLFVQAQFSWSLTIKLLYPIALESSLFLLDMSSLAFATRKTWLVSESRIPIAFLSDYLLLENTALGWEDPHKGREKVMEGEVLSGVTCDWIMNLKLWNTQGEKKAAFQKK